MPNFEVDEDVARLVERLANPKPFENITFNDALKRVLTRVLAESRSQNENLDALPAESMVIAFQSQPKKAPSPSAADWVASVPELRSKRALTNWKAICDDLKIFVGGDSARRKLRNWVKENKPSWPEVPDAG